jgi:ParB family chromosome partitioning protein
MLSAGQIEKGHAKLLASLDPDEAEAAAANIVKNKLSVKDLSNLSGHKKNLKTSPKRNKDTDVLNIEQEMSEAFGHKIEIEVKNKKKGKVNIFYTTSDELETIISKIKS